MFYLIIETYNEDTSETYSSRVAVCQDYILACRALKLMADNRVGFGDGYRLELGPGAEMPFKPVFEDSDDIPF